MATQAIRTNPPPPNREIGKQLHAVQHIRRMRGGSQAQLVRASDKQYWVAKLLGNPQHDRILANEFFVSRLGLCLGLPMPEVDIIEISDWLIQNTPEFRLDIAGWSRPFVGGLHPASHYATDIERVAVFDYLPESLFSKVLNPEFPRCLVIDKWTGNADGRQAAFTQLAGKAGYSVKLCCGFSYVVSRRNSRKVRSLFLCGDHISQFKLQIIEKGHQSTLISYKRLFPVANITFFECAGLHFQIDFGVDLGCVN